MIRQSGIIYKATNIINGKVYIGITVNTLDCRKKAHLKDAKQKKGFYFHNALSKYGVINFVWETIDTFEVKEDGINKEKYWIDVYGSWGDRGYNLTAGGQWGDTMSKHPNKEAILAKQKETAKRNGKAKGENHPLFGKNAHSFGLRRRAQEIKGKTFEEVYGKERSDEIKRRTVNTRKERNHLYDKSYLLKRHINPSKELLKFIIDYVYYDVTIMSISEVCIIFENLNKKYTKWLLQRKLKSVFPSKYVELNSMLRSRQTSGKNNPRYNKVISQETKDKISNSNKGRSKVKLRGITDDMLNSLIDEYFINPSVASLMKKFNVSDTTIKKYLRQVNLPLFHYRALTKRNQWLASHNKQEFYVT